MSDVRDIQLNHANFQHETISSAERKAEVPHHLWGLTSEIIIQEGLLNDVGSK